MTTFFEIFDRVMCVSNYALLSYMGLSLAVMSLQQPSGEMGVCYLQYLYCMDDFNLVDLNPFKLE
jgi:hypothetical protein